jgi:hypothetical protein
MSGLYHIPEIPLQDFEKIDSVYDKKTYNFRENNLSH